MGCVLSTMLVNVESRDVYDLKVERLLGIHTENGGESINFWSPKD